jgi:hypothetical protein
VAELRQVLAFGPKESEIRHFRKRELEFAQAAADLVKDTIELKIKYIPGYEASTAIRDRHLEIWISKQAFNE